MRSRLEDWFLSWFCRSIFSALPESRGILPYISVVQAQYFRSVAVTMDRKVTADQGKT